MKQKVANWGNYPVIQADVRSIRSRQDAEQFIQYPGQKIARGLGRCYGDSALSDTILETDRFNCFLDFDAEKGIVTCEAGVSLEDILDALVPPRLVPSGNPRDQICYGGRGYCLRCAW